MADQVNLQIVLYDDSDNVLASEERIFTGRSSHIDSPDNSNREIYTSSDVFIPCNGASKVRVKVYDIYGKPSDVYVRITPV